MKIFYPQDPSIVPENTGIGRVVHAQYKYLPDYGWEITPDLQKADITAAHANAGELPHVDVFHIHGLYWTGDRNSGQYGRYHDEINRRLAADARRATLLTVPSSWVAEPFKRDMRRSPVVIGHGVDLDQWSPGDNVRAYALWNKNRNKDVCNPESAHYLAMHGIPVLSTYAPDGVDIPPAMRVIGTQPHSVMRDLIRNAGIYIATTKETFGIGTLEALASGVPVLGYRHGGTADLISHQVNGYLVDPGDLDGLCAGYQWLISHRREISQNARDFAQSYGWPDVIARYASIYDRIASYNQYARQGVSVVIPNYNYGKYIADAITSCLQQTRPPEEIIVVDDGSTDDSLQILSAYQDDSRITVLSGDNHGVAHARNIGIQHALYPYIICLDADDMLDPRFIEALLPVMHRDHGLGIAYTGLAIKHPSGEMQYAHTWPPEFDVAHQMTPGVPPNNCIPSACMFRRDMWERIGGYQQAWAPGEDAEFWTRGISIGYDAKRVTEEALFIYRLHENSASRTKQYSRIDTWMPWMRDKQFPFAVPIGKAIKVRAYSDPIVDIYILAGDGPASATLDSIVGQTFREWTCYAHADVDYPAITYPFVHQLGSTALYAQLGKQWDCHTAPLKLYIRSGEYLDPQHLEDSIRHFLNTGELARGIQMGCGCNSKKAAQLAKAAINEMNDTSLDDQPSGIIKPSTIRMEFVGIQTGARTFYGNDKHRIYRGGRNPSSRYADVHPDDVESLLKTEQWRIVPRETVKPISPPPEIRPTAAAKAYDPNSVAAAMNESSAIIDSMPALIDDMPEEEQITRCAGELSGQKRPRGRPKKAVPA